MGAPRSSCAFASLLWCLLSVVLAQRVQVPNEVTGYLGKNVTLPCNFATNTPGIKVSQVTWVKESGGRKHNVAVYHPDHGPSYPMERGSRIRFRFPSLEDATLIVGPLLMTDEGTYTCEFATYPFGNEDGITNLIIVAKPTNTAEALEAKASKVMVPVANCTSANGKPPARITWQSGLNGNSTVSQVMHADGTVTVTSHYNMVPSKEANAQRITCVIEQKTLTHPESIPVTLSILFPPEVTIVGYDDNWYLSRNEATLVCKAEGNPMPTEFTWSTTSGALPRSAAVQGERLIVRNVDASVNTTFICQATNRVGQVSSEQIIFVRDQPAKRQSSSAGALAGPIVGGILALVILAAIVGVYLFFRRRRRRDAKGSYDPKIRVFGNGTAPPPARNFAELDRPLKAAPGRGQEEHGAYEEEEEEREGRRSPYSYPSRRLEDEEERFDQLGPMLRLGSASHGYEFDDMESQHDGSIISRTAVYV